MTGSYESLFLSLKKRKNRTYHVSLTDNANTTFSNNRLKTTMHTKNGSNLRFNHTHLDRFQAKTLN